MCCTSCRGVNSSCGNLIFSGLRFQRSGGLMTVELPKNTLF
jgi:hypothetical protein